MLPPSVDIHHFGPLTPPYVPQHTFFLSLTPRWDLREHWIESFSSHMTLSPRCVFRCCCWATHSSHRAPLFVQAWWHKGYIWSVHCQTPSIEHTPQQMILLCARYVFLCVTTDQTVKPGIDPLWWSLRGQTRLPSCALLTPPKSPFLHSGLYAKAVKFNPLKGGHSAINCSLTYPQGQIHGQTEANM